jgi:DNA-binding GntR family transcriptional regulator
MSSLYQQTYRTLRQNILRGELAPGERLIEQRLAERLVVSRTPIREALRQLQREGLIQADLGGGLRVTTITIADAIQLYDCRLGLEQVAAIGACENATPCQLEGLQRCLAEARTAPHPSLPAPVVDTDSLPTVPNLGATGTSALAPDLEIRLGIDQGFHHLLAQSSGNPWLVNLLDQVFSKMSLLRLTTTYRNPDVLDIWSEHERIVLAISQRDPQAAAAAVRSHLVASKARVVQELQGLPPDTVAQSLSFPMA